MSRFTDEFTKLVRDGGYNLFRLTEIKNGEATTVRFCETNRGNDSYSVAKAFTVTAIGVCVDRGLLTTEEKLTDIFSEYRPVIRDERWDSATVHDALKHRLGLPGGYLDIDAQPAAGFGKDFLKYVFETELLCAPGTERRYTDAAFYVLGRVVEKKSGLPLDRFLWENLLTPMDFAEAAWATCPMGHPMGATGLYIDTADMAKLGQLYLDGGKWNGEQLISKQWVDTVLEREYEFSWNERHTAYGKGGMFGQNLMVIPCQNRVVAWHGYLNRSSGELHRFSEEFED